MRLKKGLDQNGQTTRPNCGKRSTNYREVLALEGCFSRPVARDGENSVGGQGSVVGGQSFRVDPDTLEKPVRGRAPYWLFNSCLFV